MTISEMYRYAKKNIDDMVHRWDGGDLCAEYESKGEEEIARAMLRDWRQKQSDLMEFKRNGFKPIGQ
jgi:hypothetical protein